MANEAIGVLTTQVQRATEVEKSAEILINGFQARLEAAVAAALANGATAEEIAPLTDLAKALDTEGDALAAAVVANTPAA